MKIRSENVISVDQHHEEKVQVQPVRGVEECRVSEGQVYKNLITW